MVEVGTYLTRSDAELAQAALVMAGIPSVLAADDGAYPFDLTKAVRLLVEEADVEEAAAVLNDHSNAARKESQ